jgi:hypothetical protein
VKTQLLALAALALSAGCATTAAERQAEQVRQQRCAAIEIYPTGVVPSRPYRILGPVTVPTGGGPVRRDSSLRARACEIDADAVIDVRDEVPLQAQGEPYGAAREEQGSASGTAIAFVASP